ncbi:MAG: type I 3-dehydroquinate dehydratase [Pseudomonadota bacterium]
MKVCITIIARDTEEALEKIRRANILADILEIRLDLMESSRLEELIQTATKPVIVTYRSIREGGKGSADPEIQARHLLNAIEAHADFVDVEYRLPSPFRKRILENRNRSKVISSAHFVKETPPREELEEIFTKMAGTNPDVIKIVTQANTPEDNLRVLGLIPLSQTCGVKIITFCMGPLGRISRIASPILGGYATFASLGEGEESAAGQIPVTKMKKIWKIFNE